MSTKAQGDIGVIGLAVMGQNLILNMNDHGFTVVAYNRSTEKVDSFLAQEAAGTNIIGAHSLAELVTSCKLPRKILLMVKAGSAVDETIEKLLTLLTPGDLIIDGGNSHYTDTIRRTEYVRSRGFLFIGSGVSGGEEGARRGPSIMPGGDAQGWPLVKDIFMSISAKTPDGSNCCAWMGPNGAGHFVKMVHNGIEYGDMQLICEAYHIMRDILGLSTDAMHDLFAEWNTGELDSYLIEITRDILAYKDTDSKPLIDKILDTAGQKGTGKWTTTSALDLGIPLTLISESVFSRSLSSAKEERLAARDILKGPLTRPAINVDQCINDLKNTLYAAKIVSYAQGFALLRAASLEYGWNLDFGTIALIWRGGCIIRSAFLGKIKEAYNANPSLVNLMLDPYFATILQTGADSWRRIICLAVSCGIPVPCLSTAISYFDGYRTANLPANLLQAQRDYFGAHTYERIDSKRGTFFHTNWTGKGGNTVSGSYKA